MSPLFLVSNVVSLAVCGIIETLKTSLSTYATVRLIPSIAIEPFSTMYLSMSGDADMVIHTALSSYSRFLIMPVPSI